MKKLTQVSKQSPHAAILAALEKAGLLSDGSLVAGWGIRLGRTRLLALGVNMYDDRAAEVFRSCTESQLVALRRHFE